MRGGAARGGVGLASIPPEDFLKGSYTVVDKRCLDSEDDELTVANQG